MVSPEKPKAKHEHSQVGRFHLTPGVFGPIFWDGLYMMAWCVPKDPNKDIQAAFCDHARSLQFLLPCAECRYHYKRYLSRFPPEPHATHQLTLIRWVIGVHNSVNRRLGRPILTEEDVIRHAQAMLKATSCEITMRDRDGAVLEAGNGGSRGRMQRSNIYAETNNTTLGMSVASAVILLLLLAAVIVLPHINLNLLRTSRSTKPQRRAPARKPALSNFA